MEILSHNLHAFSKSICFPKIYILSQNLYTFSKNLYAISKSTYFLKVYIISQNPYTFQTNLNTFSKSIYFLKKIYIHAQNQHTFSKSTYFLKICVMSQEKPVRYVRTRENSKTDEISESSATSLDNFSLVLKTRIVYRF